MTGHTKQWERLGQNFPPPQYKTTIDIIFLSISFLFFFTYRGEKERHKWTMTWHEQSARSNEKKWNRTNEQTNKRTKHKKHKQTRNNVKQTNEKTNERTKKTIRNRTIVHNEKRFTISFFNISTPPP